MRKRSALLGGLLAVALLLLPSLARAECNGLQNKSAFATETVAVSTTAIGFTFATFAPVGAPVASAALVTVTAANIRFWEDGSAPTTTAGQSVVAGQSIQICGTTNIRNFLAIRDDAVDASLAVTFYR